MIEAYFNQTLTWKKRVSVNGYNEPVYEDQFFLAPNQTAQLVPIYDFPCRVEFVRKMVRSSGTQQLISEVTIFTSAVIRADDIVVYDSVEHLVLTTSPKFGFDGDVMWYEGSL